jgi:hypothetical protein
MSKIRWLLAPLGMALVGLAAIHRTGLVISAQMSHIPGPRSPSSEHDGRAGTCTTARSE